jgi:hypothetical protein
MQSPKMYSPNLVQAASYATGRYRKTGWMVDMVTALTLCTNLDPPRTADDTGVMQPQDTTPIT